MLRQNDIERKISFILPFSFPVIINLLKGSPRNFLLEKISPLISPEGNLFCLGKKFDFLSDFANTNKNLNMLHLWVCLKRIDTKRAFRVCEPLSSLLQNGMENKTNIKPNVAFHRTSMIIHHSRDGLL